MKRIVYLFLVGIILTVLFFSLHNNVAKSATPNLVDFSIVQLNWGGGSGIINSRIGEIRFTGFSLPNGGAFINIGFYNNVVSTPHWIVKNLYLTQANVGCIFGLGDSSVNRIPWENNYVNVMITDYPINYEAYMPNQTFNYIDVIHEGYCRGGLTEPGLESILGPWVGISVTSLTPTPTPGRWGPVTIGEVRPRGTIPAIDEAYCHCVPGAITRSIQYMASLNCWPVPSPQVMEGDLAKRMGTNEYYNCGTNLTPDPTSRRKNAMDGKREYAQANGLPIETTYIQGKPANMDEIINALNNGGDVEVWMYGEKDNKVTLNHFVMITKIVVHPDGSIDIYYVEDNQGDGKASNLEKMIHVEPGGRIPPEFMPEGSEGEGCVVSFMIEKFTGASRCTPTITPTPTMRVTPTATTSPTPTRRITPTPPRRIVTPTPLRRIVTSIPTPQTGTPTPTWGIGSPAPTP